MNPVPGKDAVYHCKQCGSCFFFPIPEGRTRRRKTLTEQEAIAFKLIDMVFTVDSCDDCRWDDEDEKHAAP